MQLQMSHFLVLITTCWLILAARWMHSKKKQQADFQLSTVEHETIETMAAFLCITVV